MAHLFEPITFRGVTLPNRIMFSPMDQYVSGEDARVTDWHVVHYATRTVGGTGLVMVESTVVESRGRTEPVNLGIYDEEQVEGLTRIARTCHQLGGVVGLQLGHSGRKAFRPTKGQWAEPIVAPSAIPFAPGWVVPRALTVPEIDGIVEAFRTGARRTLEAGYDVLELHGAHGYLINEFLSPVANRRDDEYGGSLANRLRFPLRVIDATREVWPDRLPLFVRVSAIDYTSGGIEMEEMIEIVRALAARGVDLIDCSAGGIVKDAWPPETPGFQVPYAQRIREATGVPTGAVGQISSAEQADEIVRSGRADLVILGRELLRHPYWPLDAAEELGADIPWPKPYRRARRASRAVFHG